MKRDRVGLAVTNNHAQNFVAILLTILAAIETRIRNPGTDKRVHALGLHKDLILGAVG